MRQRKQKDNSCANNSISSAYKSKTDSPTYFSHVRFDGSELPDAIKETRIAYDRTSHIPIDVNAIPDYMSNNIAKAALVQDRSISISPEAVKS